jgi:putative DNA methylase
MTATQHPVISPKKLIEVALPLDAINEAAAKEKSIRHGHPSTLHLWWARRPLAAARAVIFGQLVHDPEDLWRTQNPGVEPNKQNKGHWTRERARLFKIIEDLVKWENTTNEQVLEAARAEIRRSWKITCELNKDHPQAAELFNPDKMPGLHDPFAGGGTIPLEAQRLGLEAYASDLNPVAVLINKAMIEIPPKYAGCPPVHPETREVRALFNKQWKGAEGLAEDVRRYGQWMRDEAERRIGDLYPRVTVTKEMAKERPDLEHYVGQQLTVIAWLWTRTVKSPNPAFANVDVPLASTFMLSNKAGKEAYVEPLIEDGGYRFAVRVGRPKDAEATKNGTKTGERGAHFLCVMSQTPISGDYLKAEGVAGRIGARLMGIVAEGGGERVYLSPTLEQSTAAQCDHDSYEPTLELPKESKGRTAFWCVLYGLTNYSKLFTPRQLAALTTFSDLVGEAMQRVRRDAAAIGLSDDPTPLRDGGTGAIAYAETVGTYLAFALDKVADRGSTISRWDPTPTQSGIINTFSRQALPMTWDFAESNPIGAASGNYVSAVELVTKVINKLPVQAAGRSEQADASIQTTSSAKVVSTDPPYYDNIGYADLSDFFYVWLRRSLRTSFPELFATLAVPKAEELVATPYRHGSKDKAETFFLDGMTQAMRRLVEQAHPAFPVTIYYAFKQSETKGAEGTSSSGWETFLDAVIRAGFGISGTWPMRTELGNRMIGAGTNALASSIILVCRPRVAGLGTISRRQFVRMLNETLPLALDAMTRESEGEHSPVAPVDLSQAIIGPGMAIFSRYDAVLEADGTPMTVKTALQLINRFLAEDDFDADTQFCLHWFEQHGWDTGKFGEADTLARAKGTSVDGVKQSGVVEAGGGNVRLLRWKDYPTDWDARSDSRLPVWEALHQLIRAYQTEGDAGASKVLAAVASKAETSRQLAYRLYTLCERKGWAEDARAYNEVVTGWSSIETSAAKIPGPSQGILFDSTKETP